MNKKLLVGVFIAIVFLASGCGEKALCNKPYIPFEDDCCLDKNDNDICDNDEGAVTTTTEPTTTPTTTETGEGYNFISIGPGAGGTFWAGEVDPTNENIAYLTSDVGGVFRTMDGGKTWKIINSGLGNKNSNALGVVNLKIDEKNTNILYVSTWDGLYKSTDKGDHWNLILDSDTVSEVIIDGNELIVGIGDPFEDDEGEGAIYKGNKGNWEKLQFDNEGTAVVQSIVKKGDIIYIATNYNGVYKYEGGAFRKLNDGLTVLKTRSMIIDGSNIYLTAYDASSGTGGVYQLEGESWEDITGNLEIKKAAGLGATYNLFPFMAVDGTLFVGTETSLFKREKGETEWKAVTENLAYGWLDWVGFNVWFIMGNPNVIYLGNENIYKSTDGGVTFKQVYTNKIAERTYSGRGPENMYVYDIAFDPQNKDKLYIGYDDFEFFISNDKGITMKKPAEPETFEGGAINNLFVNPKQPSVIYASSSANAVDYILEYPSSYNAGSVYKSTDYGESWEDVGKSLPQGKTELYVDFDSSVLYAAVWLEALYKSNDDGKTWQKIVNGISNEHVKGIWRIAKAANGDLYIGINSLNGAVYKSTDDGESWKKLNAPVGHIIELEAKNNLVYASIADAGEDEDSRANGLYISEDSGKTWKRTLNQPRVSVIAFDEKNQNRMLAASSMWYRNYDNIDAGIYESLDKGFTWKKVAEIPENNYILSMKINPLTDELFVGTHGNGLFKTVPKDFKFPSLNILPDEVFSFGSPIIGCYDRWKTEPKCHAGDEDRASCKAYMKTYCDTGEYPE